MLNHPKRQHININNLLLDVENYRFVNKPSTQKDARDALIVDQGKKLVDLADDIIQDGLSPYEQCIVMEADNNGTNTYIVLEGNRRLVAIQLVLNPDLAKGTPLHKAFIKRNLTSAVGIPQELECAIVSSKEVALKWINKKHTRVLT